MTSVGSIEPASAWELADRRQCIVGWNRRSACLDVVAQAWQLFGWSARKRSGLSNARNRAISEAAGDYIIFIDDDETPEPDWLVAYEKAIRTEHPDAMGGRIDVMFEDGERPRWLQDELLGFLGRLDYGESARRLEDPRTPVFSGNFGFRKEVFGRVGMFDAGLGRKGDGQYRRRGYRYLSTVDRCWLPGLVGARGGDPSSHPGRQAEARVFPRPALSTGTDRGSPQAWICVPVATSLSRSATLACVQGGGYGAHRIGPRRLAPQGDERCLLSRLRWRMDVEQAQQGFEQRCDLPSSPAPTIEASCCDACWHR